MRVARRKMRGKPCYYHLYNRTGDTLEPLPITEPVKAYACALVQDLARYFTLDIISYAWMGNHFHIVLYASGVAPDLATAAKRHNAYYAKRGDQLDPVSHADIVAKIATRMADISEFMKALQQRVTVHRHQLRKLERGGGSLWVERFKSSIIGLGKMPPGIIAAEERQDDQPGGVWRCVKYVELNPCRAGLVRDPGDYPYSTWGTYRGTRSHPFYRHFVHHMRSSLAGMGGAVIETWSGRQVCDEFSRQLSETLAHEASEFTARQRLAQNALASDGRAVTASGSLPPGASTTNAATTPANATDSASRAQASSPAYPTVTITPSGAASPWATTPPTPVTQAQRFAEPGRHWIDGEIIGSERFVRWVASHFTSQDALVSKHLGEAVDGDLPLVTLNRLRQGQPRARLASSR